MAAGQTLDLLPLYAQRRPSAATVKRVQRMNTAREDARPLRAPLRDGRLVVLVILVALGGRGLVAGLFDDPALQTWSTIFVSITVQALPFLVLGVLLSGAIDAFVPPGWLARVLPTRTAMAVPVAGLAGAALPGCECASVPIAARLRARGVTPGAAVAFMLAAPAINPGVLAATAVAFPGRPQMVLARFLASLLTAVVTGLVWSWVGRDVPMRSRTRPERTGSRLGALAATAREDFLQAGGWLVVGAAAAATLQVVVPRSVIDTVAGNELAAAAGLAVLAVVLAICSEADAFVAAGLRQFSLTARLVFLVVGPAVDVKLIAMHVGVFGHRFALRFAPLTLAVAVTSAVLVGRWLL
jgi:uncharacterized membrane protein YraQ (UPF0718 family)